MANGRSESEVFLLSSGPRSGLKREFAFALRSQSQFSDSMSRTRSGKKRLRVSDGNSSEHPSNKEEHPNLPNAKTSHIPLNEIQLDVNHRVQMDSAVSTIDDGGNGLIRALDEPAQDNPPGCERGSVGFVGIDRAEKSIECDRISASSHGGIEGSNIITVQSKVVVAGTGSSEGQMCPQEEHVDDRPVPLQTYRLAMDMDDQANTTLAALASRRAMNNGKSRRRPARRGAVTSINFSTEAAHKLGKLEKSEVPVEKMCAENGTITQSVQVEKCAENGIIKQSVQAEKMCAENGTIKQSVQVEKMCGENGNIGESVEGSENELMHCTTKTQQHVGNETVVGDVLEVSDTTHLLNCSLNSEEMKGVPPEVVSGDIGKEGMDNMTRVEGRISVYICRSEEDKASGLSRVSSDEIIEMANNASRQEDENNGSSAFVISDGNHSAQSSSLETSTAASPVPCILRITRSLSLKQSQEPIDVIDVSERAAALNKEPEDSSLPESSTGDVIENPGIRFSARVASAFSRTNVELKMSKKIISDNAPMTIKKLLSTGLLEGLAVKYLGSYKCSEGLRGTIQGLSILCSCCFCKGTQAISAFQFERHAGSLKKRSAEYIFLENGRTIRDIINACRDVPPDMLEETILNAISAEPVKRTKMCKICKGTFDPLGGGNSTICTPCLQVKRLEFDDSQSRKAACELPKSSSAPKPSGNVLSNSLALKKAGRVTKKDLGLHKLVFSEGGLPDGTELAYYSRGQRLLEGYKKGFGIFCFCCNSVVSPSLFEAHAGWASRRKPYLSIYTSNGVSLHELSLSLSKGRKSSVSHKDDLCSICFEGGNLISCNQCPRAFHADCIGLSTIPTEQWYCRYCYNMMQRERFVERNVNAIAAGRVLGVDPLEQICKRSIRIVEVKAPASDASSCVLCRLPDFSKSGFGPRTVLLCDQCEKEYHVSCLKDHAMADLKELPKEEWFCCSDCSQIHAALQKLVTSGPWVLPQPLMDVMKKKHEEKGATGEDVHDVRWRFLKGKTASRDSKLLLSQAVGIFHDCFDPIIDSITGRDLIPSMVYGRSMRYQDFGGMYCAILTVGSSVVSAGILRVFGQNAAELPLVATGLEKQGLGYFQALFSCIERLLQQLHVRHLVLPAADEAESIWKNRFGFREFGQNQLCPFTEPRLMKFMGTSMLHKEVLQI